MVLLSPSHNKIQPNWSILLMEALSKSIYLRGTAVSPDRHGVSEEIMREDASASINDSAHKRSIHYHPFEQTMMGACQVEDPEEKTYRNTHAHSDPATYAKPQQREKVGRHCCNYTYRALLSEHRLLMKPKMDPKAIENRDRLVRQNEERKAGRVEHFKANLLKRVHFEGSDEVESSIQEEIVESTEARQARVQGFLKRQQFHAQEKAILRDMRQFCQYGAIRIT